MKVGNLVRILVSLRKSTDKSGAYDARIAEIKKFKASKLYVGLIAGASKESVLEYGAYHEFGTSRIPARSFVRGWYDEKKTDAEAAIARMAASVVAGKRTADDALNLLGQAFAAGMQNRISAGINPPLNPKTIARKGSSKPLVDTGQLRTSITYEIRRS